MLVLHRVLALHLALHVERLVVHLVRLGDHLGDDLELDRGRVRQRRCQLCIMIVCKSALGMCIRFGSTGRWGRG